MKKLISLALALLVLLSCAATAYAVDDSRAFFFELSVDGTDQKQVLPGDVITVVFTLHRTDSQDDYPMYAMQNEIRYDSEFFKLVEGSAMLSDGISTTEIGLRDNFREFYMNYVSLFGGEDWKAKRLIGSFQLEVIGTSGVTKITNQDYLVSTADGRDVYAAACQDVTVILSTDCTVTFETNGGTAVPAQTVRYGETAVRPEDSVRDGYHLVGWCTDIDLQKPWNFDTDPVQGNMTLYAKWEKGAPVVEDDPSEGDGDDGDDTPGSLWWLLIPAVLALAAVAAVLLLGRKTVRFETGCDAVVPEQKVKKGSCAARPQQPSRDGRSFAGWFVDAQCTRRWDFETDKVQNSMTLYAKWV